MLGRWPCSRLPRAEPSSPSKTDATACPREAGAGIYKVGNPYQIDGTWYYPAEDWNYNETGIASWYGEQFHGKYTANGEIFDLNQMTAAHRTLPMPSIVRVTNLDNGRSVEVRVNDRGPYARGRIIDLSRRAAQLLGYEGQGTAKVRVQIMVPESIQVASLAGRRGTDPSGRRHRTAAIGSGAPVAARRRRGIAAAARQSLPRPPQPTPLPPAPTVAALQPPPPSPADRRRYAAATDRAGRAGRAGRGIYIQAGAFSTIDRAAHLKVLLDHYGPVNVSSVKIGNATMYRVRVGPMPSVDQADALLNQVITTSPEAQIVVN